MNKQKGMKRLLSVVLAIAVAFTMMPLIDASVHAEDGGLTLDLVKETTTYEQGDPVLVKASGDPNGSKMAWVGLYKKGETPGSENLYSLRWYDVGAHENEQIDITDKQWEKSRKENIRPGEYTIFLFGDGDYDVVKKIDITITAKQNPATTDDLKMEMVGGKTSFVEGEPVYVQASGDPDEELQAWVGMYKKGEVPGSGVYSLRWYYISAHEGEQVNIADKSMEGDRPGTVSPGEYTIFLFGNNDYDVVKSINITVTEDPNKEPAQPSDELSLNLVDPDKTTYKLGEEVKIIATGTAEGAWVGLFKADETPSANTPSLRWFYINDGYNGVKVDIMSSEFVVNNKSPLGEGDYKILLYDADNYDNLVKQIDIKIEGIIDVDPNEFTLETDKTEYAYKESIKVKASGTGIGNGAWVGLYPADTTTFGQGYLYFYYVREANGSWTIIQNRTKGSSAGQYIGDGKYKLWIFASDDYNHPIKSVDITVIRELKYRKVLREPWCTTLGLEYVTYEDDTSEYRPIPTLGGHLWGTPQKISGTATHMFVCERDADHVKVEACQSSGKGEVKQAATVKAAGKVKYVCDVCGHSYTEAIPKLAAAPKISKTSFVFNKKTQKPAVSKILDENNNAVDKAMYKISYPKTSKAVGAYTITVKFKDRYAGTYKLKYKILPKKVTIKKPKAGKKSFTASWKKASAQTTGYQVAYSLNKKFKGSKYKKVKGIKKTSVNIAKLKANKKYFVKVRAYKVVKGKTYYSAWSAVKTVKTQK